MHVNDLHTPLTVACPKCGGRLWFGEAYDWPPDRGGDFLDHVVECEHCGAEWCTANAPDEFITPSGEYWKVAIPTTYPME